VKAHPRIRLLPLLVLTFALGCEGEPDSPQVAPVVPVTPRPVVQPLPAPQPVVVDPVAQAQAALAAQDPSPQSAEPNEPTPVDDQDVIKAMKAALAAQDQESVPGASPTPTVSAQASATWMQTFQRPPVNPQLVPINRKQFDKIIEFNQVRVNDLPPWLRQLASNCPVLSTLTIKLVGEGLGTVAHGTKAELPIQLLTAVGEIVVDEKKEEICGFLIGRLQ
jgi:hypothetical protein